MRRGRLIGLVACLALAPAFAHAQARTDGDGQNGSPRITVQSPVLVFDRNDVLTQSAAGAALAAEVDERRRALLAENEEIYAELEAEEQDISDKRDSMTEEAFRARADAFDKKVTQVRAEQDQKARDIQDGYDAGLDALEDRMNALLPQVVRERGAVLLMERQQVYLLSGAIDITDEVIAGLDASEPEPEEDQETAE